MGTIINANFKNIDKYLSYGNIISSKACLCNSAKNSKWLMILGKKSMGTASRQAQKDNNESSLMNRCWSRSGPHEIFCTKSSPIFDFISKAKTITFFTLYHHFL